MSANREGSSKVMKLLRAFVKPVVQELPLWLTIVISLVPMTWRNWDYHVLTLHDFAWELMDLTFTSMSVVAVPATLLVLLVSWLKHGKWLKYLLYAILLPFWLVNLFLWKNFSTTWLPQIIQLVLDTNQHESSEFLKAWIGAPGSMRAYFYTALTLVAIIIGERKRKSIASFLRRSVPTVIIAILLAAMLLWGVIMGRKFVMHYDSLYEVELAEIRMQSPDLISTLHASILALKFQAQEADAAVDLALRVAAEGPSTCDTDSLDLVLVIGESYNKRHSSLYGYQLDTSPLMRSERDKGLLTVFTDVVSPYNLTSISVKNMFSLNSLGRGERWYEQPFWFAVMRHAGWQVDMWGNQRYFMSNLVFSTSLNSVMFAPEYEGRVYHAVNEKPFRLDSTLVDDYYSKWEPSKHNLVVFHLMGQHTAYEYRYPQKPQWEKWTTADLPHADAPYLDEPRRQVILDYARATLYNDYVLSMILDHYRDRNAVVVMLSDHGEEVYDYRDFVERDHNPHKTPEMVHCENDIPLFIWCSPIYKSRNPERFAAIQAAASRPMMCDLIGQMMLWLGQVNSQWTDSTRNALHPAYQPAPRIIYDGIDYDQLVSGQR